MPPTRMSRTPPLICPSSTSKIKYQISQLNRHYSKLHTPSESEHLVGLHPQLRPDLLDQVAQNGWPAAQAHQVCVDCAHALLDFLLVDEAAEASPVGLRHYVD